MKEEEGSAPKPSATELVFIGELSDETKTVLNPNSTVWWTPGDAICIYYGESAGDKFTAINDVPVARAEFHGTLSAFTGVTETGDYNYFWALYPYSSAVSCDGTNVTATLPHEQVALAGSFAPNTNITLAKSPGLALSFYNVCSGMWFTVTKEGVESVTFRGNNNEDVAGTFLVSMSEGETPRPTKPVPAVGQKSITLRAPEGETFQVGEKYYIVLLPQTFTSGVTLTFNTATETGTRVYGSSMTFERSLYKYSNQADKNVQYVPKDAPSAPVVKVNNGQGVVILPAEVGAEGSVVVDFSAVTDEGNYELRYSTEAGAKKPGRIYVIGKSGSSVGTLSGVLPQSTVILLSGKYAATELTTALSTLIIEVGVVVGTVNVTGGSVTVNGEITSLNVHEDAATDQEEENKIIVIINNTVQVVSVEETNCSIVVSADGSVEVLDTQAKETEIGGTVQDLTAGENAGSVTVADGGSVTGTLDTQAESTTVEEGATVGSLNASGDGSVEVEGGATVDAISATGDVEVTVSEDAKTSTGDVPAQFEAKLSNGAEILPASGAESLAVTVSSNVAWSFTIPAAVTWVRTSTGGSTQSGEGGKTFFLMVDANPGAIARQAGLLFLYGDNSATHQLRQNGSGGITGGIDDWEDDGEAEFGKI